MTAYSLLDATWCGKKEVLPDIFLQFSSRQTWGISVQIVPAGIET